MRTINKRFRRSGILHTLLKRNKDLALYAVGGTHSDMTAYWEVLKIQKEKYWYVTFESQPAPEQSGIDIRRFFINCSAALHYFNNLTYWDNPISGEAILRSYLSCTSPEAIPEPLNEGKHTVRYILI